MLCNNWRINSLAPIDVKGFYVLFFGRWKASLIAATVVLVLVTRFRKMPKAFLIRNGKLRNLAYTFVTSAPPGLTS